MFLGYIFSKTLMTYIILASYWGQLQDKLDCVEYIWHRTYSWYRQWRRTHWMLTQRKSECSGPSMFAWSNVQWLGQILRELGLTDKWGICGRGRAPVLQVNPPSPPPTSNARSTLVLYYAIKLTKRLGNISTNITKFHKLTWSFLSVDQYFALSFRRNLQ